MSIVTRLQHAWNAFTNNRDPTSPYERMPHFADMGATYSYRPDRPRFTLGNDRSIATAVYNRIAMDASAMAIKHVRVDAEERYLEDMPSKLNKCLTLEANIDQTGRAFIHDLVLSMIDEGVVAAVPVDTTFDPAVTDSYDILSLRTAKIKEWAPKHIRVQLYNDKTGLKEEIWVPKDKVGIFENPFYAVMNEPNSTLKRLIHKLNLLDAIDEQTSSGKLDLIIQLPYVIKTDARRLQAEARRKDIEMQLTGSKYGIAYTDGTERITQLNRPVENNLMKQIEYLTSMLYSQLGMNQSVLDGTADEQTMLTYDIKTIEPIVSVIVDEMKRKFLTKTARSQGQSIMYFRDPFKFVTATNLANIGDALTRNEIASSNEIRQKMGWKPSKDPKADQLVNSNMPQAKPTTNQTPSDQPSNEPKETEKGGKIQNGEL